MNIIRGILRTSAEVQIADEFYSNKISQVSNKQNLSKKISTKTVSGLEDDHLHIHKSKPVNDENNPNQANLVNRNIRMKPTQASTEKSLNFVSSNDPKKVTTCGKYVSTDHPVNENTNNILPSTFKNSFKNSFRGSTCTDVEEENYLATNTSLNMSVCNKSRTQIRRNTDKLFYGTDNLLNDVTSDDEEDDEEDTQNVFSTNTSLNMSMCNRSRIEIRRNTDKLFYDSNNLFDDAESDEDDDDSV